MLTMKMTTRTMVGTLDDERLKGAARPPYRVAFESEPQSRPAGCPLWLFADMAYCCAHVRFWE